MTDSNDSNHISESILIKYHQTGFKPVPMCENGVTPNVSGLIFQISDSPNIKALEQQVARPASSNTQSQYQSSQQHECCKMANTIAISPKPGIKCCARNNKFCDTQFHSTAERTLEKFQKLTNEEWFWTGEYPYCICAHHVEQHCTIHDRYNRIVAIHCHGNNESCNCELFRTLCIRLDLLESNSNCNTLPSEIYYTKTRR